MLRFIQNKVAPLHSQSKYITDNEVHTDDIALANVSDTQIEEINNEITSLKDQIEKINKEINKEINNEINNEITSLKDQIEKINKEITSLKDQITKLIPLPPPPGGGKLRKSKRKTRIRYKNRKSKKH
jgi:chromosome segregation ATPase